MARKSITIRIDPELLKAIDAEASKQKRSRSQLIEIWLYAQKIASVAKMIVNNEQEVIGIIGESEESVEKMRKDFQTHRAEKARPKAPKAKPQIKYRTEKICSKCKGQIIGGRCLNCD